MVECVGGQNGISRTVTWKRSFASVRVPAEGVRERVWVAFETPVFTMVFGTNAMWVLAGLANTSSVSIDTSSRRRAIPIRLLALLVYPVPVAQMIKVPPLAMKELVKPKGPAPLMTAVARNMGEVIGPVPAKLGALIGPAKVEPPSVQNLILRLGTLVPAPTMSRASAEKSS